MALILGTNVALALVLGSFIERERRHLRRETQLFAEARSDALTGLANRRSFERIADRILAEAAPDRPISLLAMDLDHFKDINDRYGHAFGDAVLRATAKLIKHHVGAQGCAARLGGEEFVAIVELDETAAQLLAMTFRKSLENSGTLFGVTPLQVTISIGVATLQAPSLFQDGFASADRALYAAKRLGRNRVEHAPTRQRAA